MSMDNLYLLPSKRHPNGMMHPSDNLIDNASVYTLIYSLVNMNRTIDEKEVRRQFKMILDIIIQDAQNILDNNIEEIIAEAKERRVQQYAFICGQQQR